MGRKKKTQTRVKTKGAGNRGGGKTPGASELNLPWKRIRRERKSKKRNYWGKPWARRKREVVIGKQPGP